MRSVVVNHGNYSNVDAAVPSLGFGILLFVFLGMLLMSLYSFYFTRLGFPFVPTIGAIFLVVATVFRLVRCRVGSLVPLRALVVAASGASVLLLFSTLWGISRQAVIEMKGPIGASLGLLVFMLILTLSSQAKHARQILSLFYLLGFLHITFFLVQVGYYYISGGIYLDYIEWLSGEASRYGLTTFLTMPRFTGLFVEPSWFAMMAFMILTVRGIASRFHFGIFEGVVLVAGGLAFSLVGLFLLALYLLTSSVLTGQKIRALFAIVVAVFIYFNFAKETGGIDYVVSRASDPLEDHSGYQRLGIGLEGAARMGEAELLLGIGMGNHSEFSEMNGNGWTYSFKFFGLIGLPILVIALTILFRVAGATWYTLMFVAASMCATPMLTNLLWWLWISLMCVAGLTKSEPIRPGVPRRGRPVIEQRKQPLVHAPAGR